MGSLTLCVLECNDGCSGKLLTDIEELRNRTMTVEIHTMFPPPWNRLIAARNITEQLQVPVEHFYRVFLYIKVVIKTSNNFSEHS